jgi:PleD family two-component response regulator
VGVATLRPGEDDGTSLLAAADWALYQAKRSGRNQVVAAQQQG